jgi:hypothetical protein
MPSTPSPPPNAPTISPTPAMFHLTKTCSSRSLLDPIAPFIPGACVVGPVIERTRLVCTDEAHRNHHALAGSRHAGRVVAKPRATRQMSQRWSQRWATA